ncbi:MAG: 30S ribosome-binding factor RbfA [Caulobacteraceae bacterium]
MSKFSRSAGSAPRSPSQRQLRAGELVRRVLSDILRSQSFHEGPLASASLTLSEVRLTPDLRRATCFVETLGGARAEEVVSELNRLAPRLRGKLGGEIELRFTPELKFVHDESFAAAAKMDALLENPRVRADLSEEDDGRDGKGED